MQNDFINTLCEINPNPHAGGDFSGAGHGGKKADELFEASEQHDQRLLVQELRFQSTH